MGNSILYGCMQHIQCSGWDWNWNRNLWTRICKETEGENVRRCFWRDKGWNLNITCERDAGDWKEGREKNWKNVFAEPGKNLCQSSGKSFAKYSGMVKQKW